MTRANQVGGLLAVLTAIVWVLVGTLGWPPVIGVVVSMVLGGYWAFGRRLIAGSDAD